MRRLKLIPALALCAALAMVGCATPQPASVATTAPGGMIGFFDQVNGMAAVDIRVLDKRMGTQAFADAPAFHKVKFEIRNAAKLKAARQSDDLTPSQNGVYSQAFTRLPSDTNENYEISAALFGYPFAVSSVAPMELKVAEGVSQRFSLQPGERKTITIVINAVGEFAFESDETEVNSYSIDPTFVAGDTSAKALITLDSTKNPLAQSVRYGVARMVNGQFEGVTPDFQTIDKQDWNAQGPTVIPFELPDLQDSAQSETFSMFIGMFDADNNLLSLRARQFVVEPGAEVGIDVNDPLPVTVTGLFPMFTINNLPFPAGSIMPFILPASGLTALVQVTNSTSVPVGFRYFDGVTLSSLVTLQSSQSHTFTAPVQNGGHVLLQFEGMLPPP